MEEEGTVRYLGTTHSQSFTYSPLFLLLRLERTLFHIDMWLILSYLDMSIYTLAQAVLRPGRMQSIECRGAFSIVTVDI